MRASAAGDQGLINQVSKAFYPWGYFLTFLISGLVLSYGQLSILINVVVFLLGIFLPVVLFSLFRNVNKKDLNLFNSKEKPDSFLTWFLVLALAFAFAVRFYKLTELTQFPITDDGIWGFNAIDLLQHWNWKIIRGDNLGVLSVWGVTAFFKVFGPSYGTLLLFPALLSVISIPLSYFAFRQIFSTRAALMSATFYALGFWSVYNARTCSANNLMWVIEFLVLIVLGRYLKSQKEGRRRWLALLGGLCGLGLYAYVPWLLLALLISVFVVWNELKNKSEPWGSLVLFFIFAALAVLPLVWGVLAKDGGHYGEYLLSSGVHTSISTLLGRELDYITSVFWGNRGEIYFGPVWGGMVNPVLGALFLMGCLDFFKNRQSHLVRWMLLGAGAYFVSAMFFNHVVLCRVSAALPVFCAIATVGFLFLVNHVKPAFAAVFLISVILSSALLDFHHLLLAPVTNQWSGARIQLQDPKLQNDYWAAEQILKEEASQKGPGLIFTYFNQSLWDQTLTLATYPYNAALNSKYNPESAGWFALLVDRTEKSLLMEKYPQGHFYWLSENLERKGDSYLLIVDMTRETLNDARRLLAAHQSLEGFISMMMEHQLYFHDPVFTKKWIELKPLFEDNDFLQNYYFVHLLNFATLDKDPVQCLSAVDGYFESEGSNQLFFNALAKNVRQPVLYPGAEAAAEKAEVQYGLLSSHYLKKGDAVESRHFHELQGETFVLMNLFCLQMNQPKKAASYLGKAHKILGSQADIYLKRMMDYKDKPLQVITGWGA
jgi:hypothetical protein